MIVYYLSHPNFSTGKSQDIGGHIAHAMGIIQGFADIDEVVVVSRKPLATRQSKSIRYELVSINPSLLKMPFIGRAYWDIKSLLRIRQLSRKLNPSFIYTRFSLMSLSNVLLRILTGKTVVMEINTPAFVMDYNKVFRKIVFPCIDRANIVGAKLIVVVSEQLKQLICSRYPSVAAKIKTSINAVDPEVFVPQPKAKHILEKYGISRRHVVIGFSGMIMDYHGVPLLINAFARLKRLVNVESWLLIIGGGPMEDEISDLIKRVNIRNAIVTGKIEFSLMPEYLSVCDILVSPIVSSRTHFSPIKLFEYMSMGKCVIASNVGQHIDIIRDGENGFLFESDNVASLTRVMQEALSNPSRRHSIGENARSDVCKMHTWSKRTEEIYNIIANKK